MFVCHIFMISQGLGGCWFSVSIRMSIYKFLNARSLDYTAVVVGGNFERS